MMEVISCPRLYIIFVLYYDELQFVLEPEFVFFDVIVLFYDIRDVMLSERVIHSTTYSH